jgi:dihydrofolate reductase
MRQLILSMLISLDGFIAHPDGDLSWFRTGPAFDDEVLALLRSVDAMIFGRVAYQALATYWPSAAAIATSPQQREIADLMNAAPKVVASTTLHDPPWGPARVIGSDLVGEITALKREPGKDLVAFAGARLARALIEPGLVDRYRFYVHPLVLGRGIRLLDGLTERTLTLTSVRALPTGVAVVEYAAAA